MYNPHRQQSSLYWDGTPQAVSPPPSHQQHRSSPGGHQSLPPEKDTANHKGDADRSAPADTFPVTYALVKNSSHPDHHPALASILEADAVSAGYVGAVLDELRRFIDFHESQSTATTLPSTTTNTTTHHNRVLLEDLVVSKRVSAALGGATARSVSARQELRDMASHRSAQLKQVEECIRVLTLTPTGDPLLTNS